MKYYFLIIRLNFLFLSCWQLKNHGVLKNNKNHKIQLIM